MKTMIKITHKNRLGYLLSVLIIMFVIQIGQTQVYVEQSGADLTELDATDYDRELIIKTTIETINRYAEIGNFLSPTGQFSDEKYAEFLGLFSGGAKVFNDIVEKDGDNIEYAVYADNIFQYMQGTGVKFELNDVYLDKIKYDSGGFYIVTLSMEKLMLNGINDNNVATIYNNGKPTPLEMKIEMPDYDITQATIISILGEGQKMKLERSTMITLDGIYNLGQVIATNNDTYSGFESGVEYPMEYNSYGVESLFKISLNQSKTLYALIGAQVAFHNYSVDLSNFRGSESLDESIESIVGGLEYINTGSTSPEAVDATTTLFTPLGFAFGEDLQVVAIDVPIGISYALASTYDYDFFIDFAIVPHYSFSGSGAFNSNGLNIVSLPTDTIKFSSAAENYATEENIAPFYTSLNSFDKATTILSNFSLGAMIAPNFHYKFSYRMALELGLNVQYNFMPMFLPGHNDGRTDQSLVEYTTNQESVYTSTFQHYFSNINLLRYGVKVGVVFKL